jgi:hypothetical protein
VERGREGRGTAGRGGDCAAAPGQLGSERKKKKGKGKGRLTGGAQVSALAGKKKKKRRRGGSARVLADGPLGPSGLKGGPAMFSFFFLFQTSFSNHFSFQIQIKLFKLFLKNFINFLETTQATKSHASQLMMHKHLLSLSLLNYI